jgi:hypothetical protein
MARLFTRNDEPDTDLGEDSVRVVPDRDPTVVEDDGPLVSDDELRARAFRDEQLRRRILQDELERKGVVRPLRVGNGAAAAGLTLGIVSIAAGLVPPLFAGALALGLVALFLGAAGRRRARDPQRVGSGTATLAMVCALVGIALGVLGLLIQADVVNTFDDQLGDIHQELQDIDQNLGDALN